VATYLVSNPRRSTCRSLSLKHVFWHGGVIKAFTKAASTIHFRQKRINAEANDTHAQLSVTNLQWEVDSLKPALQTPAK